MRRTYTTDVSVLTRTLVILLFIFVSQIVAETAIHIGLNLNDSFSNHQLSNENTTYAEIIKLRGQQSSVEAEKQGVCGLDYFCENGGKCAKAQGRKCECKQGISGEYCQSIDECVGNANKCGNDPDAQCVYDTKEEKAMCTCKNQLNLFDEEKMKCREKCLADYYCRNGGKCVNNFCQCLPGTSGDDCDIVDACSTDDKTRKECGEPDNVYCKYNTTTYGHSCRCRITDFFYDPYVMSCKECYCGIVGNCSFVKGNKTCDCPDGFSVNPYEYHWPYGDIAMCKECQCGEGGYDCEFTGYYTKKCSCYEGYSQDFYSKCAECNCGPHGKCRFEGWRKVCDCDVGFANNDGTCEVCYCGPNGDCKFQNGNKTCECQDGYAVDDRWYSGICRECDCYFGWEKLNCTFSSGVANCVCPTGYEQEWRNCVDVNECLDWNACPSNTICKNTPGSYECFCERGYRPSREGDVKNYGCEDINECVESNPCPFTDTTECENLPGSFTCVCKSGFSPQSNEESLEYIGCWKDQSSWRVAYIMLSILFILIILGLILAIGKQRGHI